LERIRTPGDAGSLADPVAARLRNGVRHLRRSERLMIGLDNPLHIAMLLVVLLLIFGAKRLPEMGRSLGAGLRGFKESVTGQETPPQVEE
jgi:TatA/E family protein of Tat protein translocase